MVGRKEYRVDPLDLKPNTAVGVMLPLGGAPIFKSSYTTEEQAISNLKNLLLTRKGERPFQPNFGTEIYSLLFEQIELDTAESLEASIRADIKYWLPYIIVSELVVTTEEDLNRVQIKLSVKVTNTGANTNIIIYVTNQGNISIV
jgi:phage baseplate assembly protein W